MKPANLKFAFVFEQASNQIYHAAIGEGLPKHDHPYAHATLCVSGSIKVSKDNYELIMTKDTKPILLKGDEWHEIEALENNTVFINIFKDQR